MKTLLANEPVIPVVIANPEPEQTVWNFHRKFSMVKSDPSRPEAACFLQPKRWML
jgi:hypothetical protein